MPDLGPILNTLRHDIWSGIAVVMGFGLIAIVPALVIAFVAAARTEPTRWRDVPSGAFWGWLAGVPVCSLVFFVLCGFVVMLRISRIRRIGNIYIEPFVVIACIGFVAGGVVMYRASRHYFHRKIIELHGWKIDDPPPQPGNRWRTFSLRNLIVWQFVLAFVFALWVGARRDYIQMLYRWKREAAARQAQEASLSNRFRIDGWEAFTWADGGLTLTDWKNKVTFKLSMLERIEPSDKLTRFAAGSDDITDAALEVLSRNPELEFISLKSNQVTDAGIAYLAKLKSLKTLRLSCPQLTGDALTTLEKMSSLQEVDIYQSQLPKARIEAFKTARPDVKGWMSGSLSELIEVKE